MIRDVQKPDPMRAEDLGERGMERLQHALAQQTEALGESGRVVLGLLEAVAGPHTLPAALHNLKVREHESKGVQFPQMLH